MKTIFSIFTTTWYIWVGIILFGILNRFRKIIKGFLGEKSVAFFLWKLDPNQYKVLYDVILEISDKTTQIDHIIVSNYGIFVIETKNYQGWFMGDELSQYPTQVNYNILITCIALNGK